jgi:hypothetical protein
MRAFMAIKIYWTGRSPTAVLTVNNLCIANDGRKLAEIC